MGLIDLETLARNTMQVTEPRWKQTPGDRAEPMPNAWRRLFGEPMGSPLLFHFFTWEGRGLVMQFYPRGRVAVLDPAQGHQIRELKSGWKELVANAANEKKRLEPRVARAAIEWLRQQNP